MFTGTFDGNGYTISNLTIYNTDTFYTGLFACIGADGKVFDLTLENIRLQGTNYIGGVAGYALGAVTNCKVTGNIFNIALNSNDVFLGGIAGRAENELNGCTTEVTISVIEIKATAAYIGGVAGYFAYQNLVALSLVSYSDLTITKSVDEATVYAGGIFGYTAMKFIRLYDCVAEGNVTVELLDGNSIAGGLIGYCDECATLINCYALGNVSGSSYVGGLIGQMERQATLSNCYATGNVSSNNYGGGLIGYLIGGRRNVLTNCYATGDVTVKEQPSGEKYAGGLIGYGTSVDLTNCHTEGDVIVNETAGYHTYIGGLVGYFSSSSHTLINCYATGDISGNVSAVCYAGGLVGNSNNNSDTFTNCYATGNINITVKVLNAQNNNSLVCIGGLVGRFNVGGGETVIQNSYSTSKIICTGTAATAYLGGLVGYAREVTLTNAHWLYFADSGAEYAVGYSGALGIPTNIGATKHSGIAEFYTLADTLNEGQETPAWEHTGVNTLPTLIKKENQTEEIAL